MHYGHHMNVFFYFFAVDYERVCAKTLKSQSASILMIVKSQSEASVNPQSELQKMGLDMGMCHDN